MELYKKYRPKGFADMVGQAEAVKCLRRMVETKKVPHSILFSGPSGVGKTTAARILKTELRCGDMDCCEINAAKTRGIDTIREIDAEIGLAPMSGRCKVYILDEAHQLTKKAGGDAQTALLKILEDTPRHVYFLLCTTDPNQLLKTIVNRCSQVKLVSVSTSDMDTLIRRVLDREKQQLTDEVVTKIIEVAEGSPRKALVLLEQAINLDTVEEQLGILQNADLNKQAIDIARALMIPSTRWADMAKILKAVDDDAEGIRRLILSYASSVLLSGGKLAGRAAAILSGFEMNFYVSGKPGLVAACYSILQK